MDSFSELQGPDDVYQQFATEFRIICSVAERPLIVDVPDAAKEDVIFALPAPSEGEEREASVALGIAHLSSQTKIIFRVEGSSIDQGTRGGRSLCEIYYIPDADDVIALNTSNASITISPLTGNTQSRVLQHSESVRLPIATYRLEFGSTMAWAFRILPRIQPQPLVLEGTASTDRAAVRTGEKRLNEASPSSLDIFNPNAITSDNQDNQDRSRLIRAIPGRSEQAEAMSLLSLRNGQAVEVPGTRETAPYRVMRLRPIASVALSEVYLAQHSAVPSAIVVKVIRHNQGVQGSSTNAIIRRIDNWLNEFSISQKLEHSSIVKVLGGDSRSLSLLLEHIPGSDLAAPQRWRGRDNYFKGSLEQAERTWRDIAGAIAYVHNVGIVHNDIKPQNILFTEERGAVLCDFGLASLTDDASTNAGTPYYVPPEYADRGLRGAPGDIWAFGVTMLYLLKLSPLPDTYSKSLYWQIADLHGFGKSGIAVKSMRTWTQKVFNLVANADCDPGHNDLLRGMLTEKAETRLSAQSLIDKLRDLRGKRNTGAAVTILPGSQTKKDKQSEDGNASKQAAGERLSPEQVTNVRQPARSRESTKSISSEEIRKILEEVDKEEGVFRKRQRHDN